MMKQSDQKNNVYEYILQTHQNNLKRYLDLAPSLGPQDLVPQKEHPKLGPIYDTRLSLMRPNKAN